MAKRGLTALVISVGILALNGGCTTRGPSAANRAPSLSVVSAPSIVLTALRPDSDRSLRMMAELGLRNPNAFALQVRGLDLEFSIDGQRLVRGMSNDIVRVPAHGEARLSVPLQVTDSDLERFERSVADTAPASPADARGRSSADPRTRVYSVAGRLFLDDNNRIDSIPFSHSASF